MKILRCIGVILLVVFACPTFGENNPAVAKFKTLEEAWTNAIKAQDRAKIEEFLRPDYTLTVALAGRLVQVDRASWLNAAVSTYVIHEFQFHEVVVREYGDTAVVSSRYTQKATVDGRDRSAEFFLTDVWLKGGDKWQVSARYSSRPELGTPPPVISSSPK